jgi:hypothetical protein
MVGDNRSGRQPTAVEHPAFCSIIERSKSPSPKCNVECLWSVESVKSGIANMLVRRKSFDSKWPKRGSNPHEPYGSRDFKSRASANSAIRPSYLNLMTYVKSILLGPAFSTPATTPDRL